MRRRGAKPSFENREPSGLGVIHTLPDSLLGSPAVFGSTRCGPGAKNRLALGLLQALGGLDSRWSNSTRKNKISLHHSNLGMPYLLLGVKKGPSLSFSRGEEHLWGAMTGMGSVGIDVASPEEFGPGYPFARAFTSGELYLAKVLCSNQPPLGAALVWSAKEASVKATGAGFHLIDPLQVNVGGPLRRVMPEHKLK